jgi:hypothetical protein
MKIGLLNNRQSRWNDSSLSKVHDVVSSFASDSVSLRKFDIYGVDELGDQLARLLDDGVDLVTINGGDGTVDAAITELIRLCGVDLPKVAILKGGATNMIGNDVGLAGNPAVALTRLLERARLGEGALPIVSRTTIRVDRPEVDFPHYGFFFGTGAICRAIHLSQRFLKSDRVHSGLGVAATFAGAISKGVTERMRGAPPNPDRIFQGQQTSLRIGSAARDEDLLLVLATTLDRLLFRSRPFWGRADEELRFMAVRHPPAKLTRALYSVLYGQGDRGLPNDDYWSENFKEFTIAADGQGVLDGELFEMSCENAVRLSTGPRVRFVVC